MNGFVIRRGTALDHDVVLELLERASLPTEDLHESTGTRFWLAEAGDRVIGAIGLELHGNDGLLRSLVVAADRRSHGLGRALVEALEQHARSAGIAQLVLLTQTATPYFERLGFEVVARDSVPGPVQASAEFRSLCPTSAVCMTKHLRQAGIGARNG